MDERILNLVYAIKAELTEEEVGILCQELLQKGIDGHGMPESGCGKRLDIYPYFYMSCGDDPRLLCNQCKPRGAKLEY